MLRLACLVRLAAFATLVAAFAACGSGAKRPTADSAAPSNRLQIGLSARVPQVDGADVLAKTPAITESDTGGQRMMKQVPLLVLVDATSTLKVAAPPEQWSALATFEPKPLETVPTVRQLRHGIFEGMAFAIPPSAIFERFVEDRKLAESNDGRGEAFDDRYDDDPPPPEDDADLEGDMPASSDRAEGQYKMRKNQEDPALARQQAIEQARAAGLLGKKENLEDLSDRAEGQYKMKKPTDPELARQYEEELEKHRRAPFRGPRSETRRVPDTRSRASKITGAIEPGAELPALQHALVVATPDAKASAIVELVAETYGSLLVAHGSDVRPLRLQFWSQYRGKEPDAKHWIEVRAIGSKIVVEAIPGAPITIGKAAELRSTYATVASRAPHELDGQVDVLVADDVTAQQLVDILVALDRAGARSISLGFAPR